MQQSSSNTIPIHSLDIPVSDSEHTKNSPAENAQASVIEDSSFLGLTQTLQSTLDISKLLELYDDEVSAFIPHDGFTYKNLKENILVELGENKSYCYTYKLVLLRKNLGEVSFYRKQPFSKDELNHLDKLVAALLYPVRNSLLYKRAIETAFRDPLTDLNNRAAMDSAFEQELDFAQRHNLPLTILLLDVDKFKSINDTYGHIAGDTVLKTIADCMRECVRRSDVLFRYGGEEFLILLRNTQIEGATLLANRIRNAVENLICKHQEHEITMTISIGVAKLRDEENKYSFLQRADEALYRAKEEGRNRVIVAD